MNAYLAIASILCFILGLAHSIIGEVMIFRDKRKPGKWIPTRGSGTWKASTIPILWATWHIASVFGWGMGLILVKMALDTSLMMLPASTFLVRVMAGTMLAGGLLVLGSTKGRHPAWVILFGISGLLILA